MFALKKPIVAIENNLKFQTKATIYLCLRQNLDINRANLFDYHTCFIINSCESKISRAIKKEN